jgi:biopolymer transport protein ExbD
LSANAVPGADVEERMDRLSKPSLPPEPREPGRRRFVAPATRWLLRRSRGRRRAANVAASLQLTPLIDVMLAALLFLLYFQGDPHVYFWHPELPFAERAAGLESAPVIQISQGVVRLDLGEVSTVRELLADDRPDWKIAMLTEQLVVKRHNWTLSHLGKAFPAEVIVEAEPGATMKALKKVIYSAALAGYTSVSFAVMQGTPRR